MPTTCWNSIPPKETNMLSMRNSSILFYECSPSLYMNLGGHARIFHIQI
jgi:hypothetical protein